MNTVVKSLCIAGGSLLLILGLCAAFIFAIVGNMTLGEKFVAVGVSLCAAFVGWWLLRRGSDSVWDAISWLIAQLIP